MSVTYGVENMSRKAIIIAPNTEPETRISVKSANYIVSALRGKGVDVTYLKGSAAINPLTLAALWRKNRASTTSSNLLILYVGHGSKDAMLGPRWMTKRAKWLRPLSKGYEDGNLLKGTIVYAISCLTLENFADKVISQGASAYLGWGTNVELSLRDIDKDDIPDFIECNLAPVAALYRGDTVAQAVEAYKTVAHQFAADFEGDVIYRDTMLNNAVGISLKGNGNARWLTE